MRVRNLADPSYEPSDEDLRELLASAAGDARERHARAEALLIERVRAERVRLGVLPAALEGLPNHADLEDLRTP